jgi:hypothetical protein
LQASTVPAFGARMRSASRPRSVRRSASTRQTRRGPPASDDGPEPEPVESSAVRRLPGCGFAVPFRVASMRGARTLATHSPRGVSSP